MPTMNEQLSEQQLALLYQEECMPHGFRVTLNLLRTRSMGACTRFEG